MNREMMITCPECHISNRADARFCHECGFALSNQGQAPGLCPAGKHPMDPAWTSCPYCSGSEAATDPLSKSAPAAGSPMPPPPGGRKRPPTTPEQQPVPASVRKPDPAPPPGGSRKKTEFHDEAPHGQEQTPAATPRPAQQGTRRIVAVLVTYSWQSQGQIFPVYEGRNYLGRDLDCEICMDADPQMSGRHSAIFYRGETFEITDEKSMNGTFVNGKSAPLTGATLENSAVIKTGATTWRFIIIPSPSGAAVTMKL